MNLHTSGAILRPKRAIVGGHRNGGAAFKFLAAWEVKITWENMPAIPRQGDSERPLNKIGGIIWPLPAWTCRIRAKCHGIHNAIHCRESDGY